MLSRYSVLNQLQLNKCGIHKRKPSLGLVGVLVPNFVPRASLNKQGQKLHVKWIVMQMFYHVYLSQYCDFIFHEYSNPSGGK